jgi:hypothetical protein
MLSIHAKKGSTAEHVAQVADYPDWGAKIYRHKMSLGALYRAVLAQRL